MAITWELTVTPIAIGSKTASVVAVGIDSEDTEKLLTYTEPNVIIDTETMANNIHILDDIWAQHQARLARDSTIDAFVSGLEAAGKANLEARV